jgi:hypothetical protein
MSVSPIPLSELGRLTGRFHLGESRPLIAMNCYFDGSAGGRADEWLTLGGLVASDSTWAKFQTDWTLMLRSRDPVAPYVHMTELLTGNGPFKRDAGWTDQKIKDLISDTTGVLASMDQTKVCGVACAVDIHAHRRLLAEGYQVPKPAVVCAEIGVGNLLPWYIERHGVELAHLFYDQGEPFIRSIRTRWLREEEKKRRIKHGFWALIANVQPLNMRDTPPIQVADVLAWAFTRRLRNELGDKWAAFADTLIGDRTRLGALTATQVYPITEELMRQKYLKRTAPRRS